MSSGSQYQCASFLCSLVPTKPAFPPQDFSGSPLCPACSRVSVRVWSARGSRPTQDLRRSPAPAVCKRPYRRHHQASRPIYRDTHDSVTGDRPVEPHGDTDMWHRGRPSCFPYHPVLRQACGRQWGIFGIFVGFLVGLRLVWRGHCSRAWVGMEGRLRGASEDSGGEKLNTKER